MSIFDGLLATNPDGSSWFDFQPGDFLSSVPVPEKMFIPGVPQMPNLGPDTTYEDQLAWRVTHRADWKEAGFDVLNDGTIQAIKGFDPYAQPGAVASTTAYIPFIGDVAWPAALGGTRGGGITNHQTGPAVAAPFFGDVSKTILIGGAVLAGLIILLAVRR